MEYREQEQQGDQVAHRKPQKKQAALGTALSHAGQKAPWDAHLFGARYNAMLSPGARAVAQDVGLSLLSGWLALVLSGEQRQGLVRVREDIRYGESHTAAPLADGGVSLCEAALQRVRVPGKRV